MIYAITGLPGAGKTLYALNYVKLMAEREKRQVYFYGITDLNLDVLPWIQLEKPEDYVNCPQGAIIFIDEAQRHGFGPRMRTGAQPAHAAKLETHRHDGFDIFLITQDIMNLDAHDRRLIEKHFHAVRRYGFQYANVHEFVSGVRENAAKNRKGSIEHTFKYPKESYTWYKSAEVHTHKAKLPARVYVLAVVPFVFGTAAYFFWQNYQKQRHPELQQAAAGQAAPSASSPGPAGGVTPKLGYVESFRPRVAGLAYTAPVYDQVTKPVRAPYPAACVQSKTRCQCYSQQGTRLEVDKQLCEGIAAGGFFMAWDEQRPASQQLVQAPAKPTGGNDGQPLPGLINATPGWTPSSGKTVAEQVADGQNLRHGKNNRIPG